MFVTLHSKVRTLLHPQRVCHHLVQVQRVHDGVVGEAAVPGDRLVGLLPDLLLVPRALVPRAYLFKMIDGAQRMKNT